MGALRLPARATRAFEARRASAKTVAGGGARGGGARGAWLEGKAWEKRERPRLRGRDQRGVLGEEPEGGGWGRDREKVLMGYRRQEL